MITPIETYAFYQIYGAVNQYAVVKCNGLLTLALTAIFAAYVSVRSFFG